MVVAACLDSYVPPAKPVVVVEVVVVVVVVLVVVVVVAVIYHQTGQPARCAHRENKKSAK